MPKSRSKTNIRLHSIWLKYAVTYLLVLMIPFAGFSVYFNYYFNARTEGDVQTAVQNTITKIQQDFDQKVSQMFAISTQLGKVRDFRALTAEYSHETRRNIQQALLSFISTNLFFSSIDYYCTLLHDVVFTSSGTWDAAYYHSFYRPDSGEWLTLNQMNAQTMPSGWIPSSSVDTSRINKSDTLIYVQPMSDVRGGYLFFEIRESSMRQLLSNLTKNSEVYIFQGNTMLYPFRTEKTPPAPAAPSVSEPIVKLSDGRYQCVRQSKATGLTYVYIVSVNGLSAMFRTVLGGFMALTALLSLVSFGAVMLASRRHARPIEQLVRQSEGIAPDDVRGVARIQSAMNQLQFRSQELDDMRQDSMRVNALIRLVRGKYHSKDEAEDNLRRLGMTYRQPYRVIVLLRQEQEWDEKDAGRAVTEILSRTHDVYSFAYADRSAFVILLGMNSDDRERLARELTALAELPQFSGKKLHFTVGGSFIDLINAQQSFMQALSSGRGASSSPVTLFQESEAEELFYPREELEALDAALDHQDRNRTIFLYDVLLTLIKKHNHIYFYTVSVLSEMINIYLQFQAKENPSLPEEGDGYAAGLEGEYINDVDDMFAFLRRLHSRAIQRMTEEDLSSSATEMTGIANYISACEELDALTVNAVADRFGMNVSSLSHRFKEQMGCNISDYILSCKMNHACALLRSTDETIADIAQKVGYSQYTSFVRTFKREKGQTPTSYRDAWRQSREQ